MRSAINSFCNAFHKISNAYTSLLTSGNISESVTNVVSVQENTYASVTKSSAPRSSANLRNRMVLKNGKTLPIRSHSQVVVGPSVTSTEIYDSSPVTKAKFLEIMKPTGIGLRINRILLSANKSIVVEGDSRNAEILSKCLSLEVEGLEIKEKAKLNPRLIIRDIPVELSSADICSAPLGKANRCAPVFSRCPQAVGIHSENQKEIHRHAFVPMCGSCLNFAMLQVLQVRSHSK